MMNISDEPIGNFFTERQLLPCTKRDGANFYSKILVPIYKYLQETDDASDFRSVDSLFIEYVQHYTFGDKYDLEKTRKDYWDNTSSISRILPIAYYENIDDKVFMRITPLAASLMEDKISIHQFLFAWVLRFQGTEFCDYGVMTKSNSFIINECSKQGLRNSMERRVVKPAILALQVLKGIKERGSMQISDKEFRHARRLTDHRDNDAVERIVDIIINEGEPDYPAQEGSLFGILEYLGLCNSVTYQQNNSKYCITDLGYDFIRKYQSQPFTYCHSSATTDQYIRYFGKELTDTEIEIMHGYVIERGV